MSTRPRILAKPIITYKPRIVGKDFKSIERMEIRSKINGENVDFTYRIRDYGRLSLWIAQLLEECRTIPEEWKSVKEKYELDDFFIAYEPPRDGFIKWTLTSELPQIRVISEGKEKRVGRGKKKRKFFLGPIGQCMFEAVQKSQNWLTSFENLVLLRLLAHKLNALGVTLNAIHNYGNIQCISTNWPSFEFSWRDLYTSLWGVFLIHAEKLDVVPECRSPNIPQVLSGTVFNESYMALFAVRKIIIEKFVGAAKNNRISTENINELSKRLPHEVSRGLEKIGVLQETRGLGYISIPNDVLSDLVRFILHYQRTQRIRLEKFIDVLKNMFRILVNPHDIKTFLKNSVTYEDFGIDLNVTTDFCRISYEALIERMVGLGLARVRPDGEVSIEVA